MERKGLKQLLEWKTRQNRKPLIMYGARQVGKTWLMKEFAAKAFNKSVYINFEDEDRLTNLFEQDFDIDRILATISLVLDTDINDDTLLILDEIQAVKRGVTALKYFAEKAPHMHVIAAGSLLGIAQHRGDSFPVGKVDSFYLHPMDFEEFLLATGRQRMADALRAQQWSVVNGSRKLFEQALREYYFVGGMPAVVNSFINDQNFDEVRRLQRDIIDNYERDFSKHAPNNEVPRIGMVWHSILGQLAKENRKFIYGAIKEGGRAKEFELAIQWLTEAGLVHKVPRIKKGELPLSAFEDFGAFKLFLLDVGLMCAMAGVSATTVIEGNQLFTTAKGALTEQYVCQQLESLRDLFIGYWSADNSRGEIDFLIQYGEKVIPIEVKAEENLKSKSLRVFVQNTPGLLGVRFSMSNYREQDWMTNYPLYCLPFVSEQWK